VGITPIPECTGVVSIALFLALLYVLRIYRSRAIRAAIFGSLALYLLDVARVYLLIRFTHSLIVAYVLWLAK